MTDADVFLNLPFFPIIMVLVAYALCRPAANGDIKLGRHLHKFILPFSQKWTTSEMFIVLVSDCYLIVLIDLIGRISGFKSALGIYSFNLLCFGIFTCIITLSLTVYVIYLAIWIRELSIFTKIGYIVLTSILCVPYTIKVIPVIFRFITKGIQALFG